MTVQHEKTSNTRWHTLFGALLDRLLTPVGIEVFIDLPVMKTPPEADIVLLRRDQPTWTAEQKALLPDGIRDCEAGHIILEFKYTQSLTEQSFQQAVGYDYFYRESNNLKPYHIQTAIVSSKTPNRRTLQRFGYTTILKPGVYQSTSPLLDRILVLVSNQLADTLHNASIKCFASRKAEQERAFAILDQCPSDTFPQSFRWLLEGLCGLFFKKGGNVMQQEITPELLTDLGKKLEEHILAYAPIEKRLAGLKPEDRLKGLKLEEVLRYFDLKDLLSGLKPEDRLAGLKPEDRLAGLKPEDRLAGLKPEDRFAGMTTEEIEQYLQKLKSSSS